MTGCPTSTSCCAACPAWTGRSSSTSAWCSTARAEFLGSASRLDEDRLRALAPGLDLAAVASALTAVEQVCRGEAHVDFGPASRATAYGSRAVVEDAGTRFGFLKAARSTVVQPGPVHGGLTDDPAAELAACSTCWWVSPRITALTR